MQVGRKIILLVSTPFMIVLLVFVSSLTKVFGLEDTQNPAVGYVIISLFCVYALVYSISWT